MRVDLLPDAPNALPVPYETPGEPDRRYFDLKRRPSLISRVRELADCADLRRLVVALNARRSLFATLGCAHWISSSRTRHEAGAYVDVVLDRLDDARLRSRSLDLADHIAALAPPSAPGRATAVIRIQPQRVLYVASSASAWMLSIWMFGSGPTPSLARSRRRSCMRLVEKGLV